MQQQTVAVIWIDWYAYHLARFRALSQHCSHRIQATGIELVGGAGVHAGMEFREDERGPLSVVTLLPDDSWHGAGQWRIARATWKKLNELKPTAVFVPGYYNAPAIAAALWGKLHGSKTVLMTESTEDDHVRNRWKEALKSVVIRSLFGWAIAGGVPHVNYLEKLGFRKDRIGRFYDVVDNDFFASTTDRLRATRHAADFGLPEKFFVYVGRLSPEKNVDGLLLAFENYRREGGKWSLVIVGDGPDRVELQALARKLGIENRIVWAGLQNTDKLSNYYAFASCFVLPSTREPWGLVVNEALASGLPAIVSRRCGCAADLIREGENGYLFEPSVPGELEQALHCVSFMNRAQRSAMAQSARAVISEYSPRHFAEEVERIASHE